MRWSPVVPRTQTPDTEVRAIAGQEDPSQRDFAGSGETRSPKRTDLAGALAAKRRHSMKTIAEVLGVSRSILSERVKGSSMKRSLYTAFSPDAELLLQVRKQRPDLR